MDTQDWIVVILTICICATSFFLFHKDMKENDKEYKLNKYIIIYSVVMSIIVVAIALVLQLKFTDNDILHNLKRICVLAVLWPIAFIDYKTYRIPNSFIIYGLVCRAIILPFELLMIESYVADIIISDIVAAAALFAATALCKLCVKNSIGAGDIKLFVVMGVHMGLNGVWGSVFMSLIVSFFIAIYLLVRKKKNRKDSIPFGPAIAIGTFISIYFSGM